MGIGDWACTHRVPPLQRQDDLPSAPPMIRTDVTLNVTPRVTLVEIPGISFPISRPDAALVTLTASRRDGFGQLRGPKPSLAVSMPVGSASHWTRPCRAGHHESRQSLSPSIGRPSAPAASHPNDRDHGDCKGGCPLPQRIPGRAPLDPSASPAISPVLPTQRRPGGHRARRGRRLNRHPVLRQTWSSSPHSCTGPSAHTRAVP